MLAPKKLKNRKPHRQHVRGLAKGNTRIAFGSFALKATTGGWIKARQIEAARKVITRYTKRGGKLWIRIFPHHSVSNKGSQTTMGGGKGVPDHYIAAIRPGSIIFELDGVERADAQEAMTLAGHKLSVMTKFIEK